VRSPTTLPFVACKPARSAAPPFRDCTPQREVVIAFFGPLESYAAILSCVNVIKPCRDN